jgi:hypothetical protein
VISGPQGVAIAAAGIAVGWIALIWVMLLERDVK